MLKIYALEATIDLHCRFYSVILYEIESHANHQQ